MQIESPKPPSGYRHYSNPDCQGTLMRRTALWPKGEPKKPEGEVMNREWEIDGYAFWGCQQEEGPATVPAGLEYGCAYLDRMGQWDRTKLDLAWKHLSKGFDSPDDELIAFARDYFEVDVVAVQTIYYFNMASGYDCPAIAYLYKKGKE